jgi:hypothetical protein
MIRRIAFLAVALLALAAPALAQELQPGARVRVTAPIVRGSSRFVGTVASMDSGRIVLRLDPTVRQDARGDTISIPLALVRRVEVSLGRTTGRGRRDAARTGALAGVALGTALGMVLGSGSDQNGAKNPWTTSLWLAPAVGALGAGAGALVGTSQHEQWRVVPHSLAGVPLGRNVTVSIRLGI